MKLMGELREDFKAKAPLKRTSLRKARVLAGAGPRPKVIQGMGKGKPGGVLDFISLGVLSFVWMAGASGTGFLLALLARRIHPGLSLVKLWFFYTILMALLVGLVFLIAWF